MTLHSTNYFEKKNQFLKNIRECYNCLFGCYGNVIRNADRDETLKSVQDYSQYR